MTFECIDKTINKNVHIDYEKVDDKLLNTDQYSYQKKAWRKMFHHRNRCIVYLIMNYGLTPLEVSELNIDDLLKDSMLHINGVHDRRIVIDTILYGLIEKYIQNERQESEEDPEALFISRKYVRITPSAIQRLIRDVFPGLSPRDLRRAVAERVLEEEGLNSVTKLFGLSTNQASKRMIGIK